MGWLVWKAVALSPLRRLGGKACRVLRAFALGPRPVKIPRGILWEFRQAAQQKLGGNLLPFHLLTPASTQAWHYLGRIYCSQFSNSSVRAKRQWAQFFCYVNANISKWVSICVKKSYKQETTLSSICFTHVLCDSIPLSSIRKQS